jgi:hypothetical protein
MVLVDGGGLPLGVRLESASPAEVTLAEATLAEVKVPRPRGRPALTSGLLKPIVLLPMICFPSRIFGLQYSIFFCMRFVPYILTTTVGANLRFISHIADANCSDRSAHR